MHSVVSFPKVICILLFAEISSVNCAVHTRPLGNSWASC